MQFRFSLAALTLLVSAPSAEGVVISTVQTFGVIVTAPHGETNVLPSNTKDGSAEPVLERGGGDDALSYASLMGTAGFLTLNSHGCSGPPPGFPLPTGTANAVGDVDYFENFLIQSDTLPNGTPVTINIKLAAARSFVANGAGGGAATVAGSAAVTFAASTAVVFQGNFSAQQVGSGLILGNRSGIFAGSPGPPEDVGDPNAGELTATLFGMVGGQFTINLTSQVGANTQAGHTQESSADGQMSLMWGADIEGGLAVIRSPTGGPLFPPTSNVTDDFVLAILPAPPFVVPEPTAAALLLIGAGLLTLRQLTLRHRSRSCA